MFRNPCHECIVRAACRKKCINYNKFEKNMIYLVISISGITYLLFIISVPLILYFITNDGPATFALFITIWFFITVITMHLIKNQSKDILVDLKSSYHAEIYLAPFFFVLTLLTVYLLKNYVRRPGEY